MTEMNATVSQIRVASVRDIEVLMPFVRDLHAHEHIPFAELRTRTVLERLLQDDRLGQVWMIIANGEPVGYAAMTFGFSLVEYGGRDAILDEIFIQEGHRRRGLGEQALRVAEDACRKAGIRALHLEVDRVNVAAQGFYRAHGFIDHDRYLMTRDLESPNSVR